MVNIDVEKILEEIRIEIKNNGYKASDLNFDDIKLPINVTDIPWNLKIYAPIPGHGFKHFIKRIVRKIVRPVFDQQFKTQQSFNDNVIKVLNELSEIIDEQQGKIEILERNLKEGK